MIVIYTQAYNSEKTIRRTIESIINQTFGEFIYYVLNNGSNDKTGEIIKEYSQKDERVIYLENKENHVWVEGAEQFYFLKKYTCDDFFVMIDADDEYKENFLERTIKYQNEFGLDIVACGSDFIDAESKKKIGERNVGENIAIEGKDFGVKFPQYYQYLRTIWGKLIKISSWSAEKFTGDEIPEYGGDTVYMLNAFYNSQKVGILSGILHKYYVSNNSNSYLFKESRLTADAFLYNAANNFLNKKVGYLSHENQVFITHVYYNALVDTINTIIKSKSIFNKKVGYINAMLSSDTYIKLFSKSAFYELYTKLNVQLDNWMFQQRIENFEESQELISEFYTLIHTYSSIEKKFKKNERLILYILIWSMTKTDKHLIEKRLYTLVKKTGVIESPNIEFINDFVEVFYLVLNEDYSTAITLLENLVSSGDIKELCIMKDLVLIGLRISAHTENIHEYLYFKKLQILIYIEENNYERARLELGMLEDDFPNDLDLNKLKQRIL
jgi:glycosyltransferase involved in cell wall biosynthesis